MEPAATAPVSSLRSLSLSFAPAHKSRGLNFPRSLPSVSPLSHLPPSTKPAPPSNPLPTPSASASSAGAAFPPTLILSAAARSKRCQKSGNFSSSPSTPPVPPPVSSGVSLSSENAPNLFCHRAVISVLFLRRPSSTKASSRLGSSLNSTKTSAILLSPLPSPFFTSAIQRTPSLPGISRSLSATSPTTAKSTPSSPTAAGSAPKPPSFARASPSARGFLFSRKTSAIPPVSTTPSSSASSKASLPKKPCSPWFLPPSRKTLSFRAMSAVRSPPSRNKANLGTAPPPSFFPTANSSAPSSIATACALCATRSPTTASSSPAPKPASS